MKTIEGMTSRHLSLSPTTTTQRMLTLKRAGSNPAGPAPTTKKSRPLYETPFPNPSSDNLAYKLPSSAPRGAGAFSPVPTSSRNLKENRVQSKTKTKRSRSKPRKGALESPFPVFGQDEDAPSRFPRRALSDKFQPNVPQSQSTTTSPQQPQYERRRRPSVPTPPRTHISFLDPPDVEAEWSVASPEVDFNRPPSQLSVYDGEGDGGMFADVQFVSTPFRFARRGAEAVDPRLLGERDNTSLSDTDTDEEGVITSPYKLLKRSLRKTRGMSAGYVTPDEDETGWISDSLISPPTRVDVEMADPEPELDFVEGLSLGSLQLGCDERPEPVRTRSLDSSALSLGPALEIKPATRRTRSGTVLQGAADEAIVGRTRSGTVTQRTRSGTVTQKRARSGSILAPPPIVGGGRARSGSILNRAPPVVGRMGVFSERMTDGDGDDEFSEDELERLTFSTPEDELPLSRPRVRRARVRDGQMKMYRHAPVEGDEGGMDEDDELLLK